MRLGLGVDRNGYGADFDGAEEGVKEFGCVQQQQEDALLGADAEVAEGVTRAISALEELLVSDNLFAAFDGDVLGAAFEDVAIHEMGGDVEELW